MLKMEDVKSFIVNGEFLDFSDTTIESDIFKVLGEPGEVEDYQNAGRYLHYDDFRFSISKGRLEYMDCFFMNTDLKLFISVDDQEYSIDKNMSVLRVIYILNVEKVKWNISYDSSKLDYLILDVANGLKFYFYYYNEKLERITKVW